MTRARLHDRRGAGFLTWVALSLLVVLGIVAWSQQRATGEASLAVSRSMAGELGLSLGQSVLEEAMHRVRSGANDPASPLFAMLRKPVAAPAAGQLALTPQLDAEQARALCEKGAFHEFSFTGPQAEVVYQRQLEDLPGERAGLIHYWTRIAGAAGISETVVREVHAYQEFRTVLITTPRPFDEMPVYLGRAGALTDLKGANEQRAKLIAQYGRAYQALVDARKAAGPAEQANYDKMLAEAAPVAQIEKSAPPVPEDTEAHVTALWMQGQAFALEAMDLARKLTAVTGEGEWRVRELEAAARGASSDAAHEHVMEVGADTLTFLLGEMLRIWGFTRAFNFVPRGDPGWDAWEQRATSRLTYEHFRRLAFFVIHEEPAYGEYGKPQPQWELLRKKVTTPAGQPMELNGVVMVENANEPLVLTGDLHGKLIVVATRGGLTLRDVNPHPEPGDSLVAVCCGGPLEVSGEVNAAVVAAPLTDAGGHLTLPRVTVRAGARVRGGMLLPGGVAAAEWNGVVEHDDRYYAGPEDGMGGAGWRDHYYVGVAPRASFRSVVRK